MTFSILFFLYCAGIGFLTYRNRNQTASGYMIAERSVGSFGIMAALAASFRDGAGIAAWIGLGVAFGFGSLWLVLGMALALISLAFLSPLAHRLASEGDWDSPGDMLRTRFGPITSVFGSLTILATALLYAAAQVFVAGELLAAFSGMPSLVALLLVAIITAAYVGIGGYSAVTITDKLQWLLIMAIVLFPFVVIGEARIPNIDTVGSAGLTTSIAFAGLSYLVILSSGDVWQRIFSARSANASRSGLIMTIPVYILISIALVIFAYSVAPFMAPESLGQAIFLIPQISEIPELARVGFGLFAIAALMSTLDTQTFLFSSTVSDLIGKKTEPKSTSVRRLTFVSMAFIFSLVLIATLIGDLVQFLFSAVTLGTVLAPVFVYSLVDTSRRHNDIVASTGILIGLVVYIWLFFGGKFSNLLWTTIPAITTGMALITALLFSRIFQPKIK